MESVLTYVRKHLFLLLIVLVFILFVIGYALGFRPGPGFTFVRTGTLVLSGVPKGATVYADQTRRAVSNGSDVRISLVPGEHSIIVDAKGNYPWSDVVTIATRSNTTVTPIEVPTQTQRVTLPDANMSTADKLLTGYVLPDEAHPLKLVHGCANVYVSENRVLATAATTTGCTPPPYLCVGGTCATTVIFAPIAPLRSVLTYPGREDTLIVSFGSTLAVLELDPLKPQFFAPLMQGVQPLAVSYDKNHILVRDAHQTFTIAF